MKSWHQRASNRLERGFVLGLSVFTVASLAPLSVGAPRGSDKPTKETVEVDAVFSPGGGCEERIAEELASAERAIRIQAYFFTSKPITNAVVKAKKRGVDVCVILDKSQEKMTYGSWRILRREGVPVHFDAKHATANNKVILIDDTTVITGSYNFTKSAEEKNAENIVIIKYADDVFEKFLKNFDDHLKHSKKYSGS